MSDYGRASSGLAGEHYTTKTRGERYQPGALAIGQGSYEFVRHADHVHFTHRLDHVERALLADKGAEP